VRQGLRDLGISWEEAPRLVRGLDYYVRTAFEVTGGGLGAQDAVLGGGRYDGLVRDLGGPDVSGFGFALGLERLILLIPEDHPDLRPAGVDLFLVAMGEAAHGRVFALARRLRAAGFSVRHDFRPRSLGPQMKRADRLGARLALILGEEELAREACVLKRMADASQEEVRLADLETAIARLLAPRGRME
jgi:histidyl-tRNA synthetase